MDLATRRNFLKIGALGAAVLTPSLSRAIAASCGLTPEQTSGPFYPGENQFHKDNDLTQNKPLGQVIYVKGRVLDGNCNPISGANVEIWQACASGRYNNPADTNTAVLDPNFKYWGETITDADGSYIFKSIKPGAYPADTNWTRPPHIHFKVSRLGFNDLITQMYFQGDLLNDKDLILQALKPADQSTVVVGFQPASNDPFALVGTFNITLQSVKS